MDNAKTIDKLNEILAHEWTGVSQYAQQSFMVRGVWREVYSKMFRDGAEESFGHANRIGDKIVALGGVPTIERNKVRQADSLEEMLQIALEFEQGAVDHYKEALKLADKSDRALVVLLEEILLDEQDGVDEITKLLREQSPGAAATGDTKKKAAG